jgi:hypothetical protein
MKTRAGIWCSIILLILLGVSRICANPFWSLDDWNTMSGQFEWLAVSAPNDSVAWAVGTDGRHAMKRTGSTFDGTWEEVDLPDYEPNPVSWCLNDVFVLPANPNYVWVVGEKRDSWAANNHKGVVLYTVNAGTDWSFKFPLEAIDQGVDSLTPFYTVCFASEYKGYIGAGNGVVLRSIDGGYSWDKVFASPGSRSDCFVDTWTPCPGTGDTVWVVGDNNSVIAKSTNGGGSWTQCQTDQFNRTYDIPDLSGPYQGKLANFDVALSSYQNGAIALSHGRAARTTNAGATWTVDSLEPRSSWFEACDYGLGDTLFLVAGDGVVRSMPGALEPFGGPRNPYFAPWLDFHDIDMNNARGFVVGDRGQDVNEGRKYMRYDPVDFHFDNLQVICYTFGSPPVQHARIELHWHTDFEVNTQYWTCGRSVTPYICKDYENSLCNAKGDDTSGSIYSGTVYVTDGVNTTYWLWMAVVDFEGARRFCGGPWPAQVNCFNWPSAPTLQPPRYLNAADYPNDQGAKVQVSWGKPSDTTNIGEYRVGRSTGPSGPFYQLSPVHFRDTTLLDTYALTGKRFYYNVRSAGEFSSSSGVGTSPVASVDNICPEAVDSLWVAWQRRYSNNDSVLVCLKWMGNTQDSTLAGYWVCPQEPQTMERGITGDSPVRRDWYVIADDWATEDTVVAGVLAMDYSDNMGDAWKDINIPILAYQTSL